MRKPTICVFDQVRHMPAGRLDTCTWNIGYRKERGFTICVAKTNALVSCAATAQLTSAFGFAYADCWFF